MTKRGVLLAACLATTALAGLLSSASAATTDILIGLDNKITWGPNGSVPVAPGPDAVLVMDISNPVKPRIRASLPLMNSLTGPPTNLGITPDGRVGLVANSMLHVPDGSAWKQVPDDKLHVIDLAANPPKLAEVVTVGKQPSGLAISRKGDLALIANRDGKSVTVLSIQGTAVKVVNEIKTDVPAAAVAISPDGKRAFVCFNTVNKVGVLAIDGQTVTYDKAMDLPVAFAPYNVDFAPDGKYVFVSNVGAQNGNNDAIVTIEATGPHPHVIDLMSPGSGAEGFAVAPNGKTAATPLLSGTGAKPSDWFFTKTSELVLMSVGPKGKLTVTARSQLGRLPEGIAYSADSQYIYVGNYLDSDLQIFHINNGKLQEITPKVKLPGQPASIRAPVR